MLPEGFKPATPVSKVQATENIYKPRPHGCLQIDAVWYCCCLAVLLDADSLPTVSKSTTIRKVQKAVLYYDTWAKRSVKLNKRGVS